MKNNVIGCLKGCAPIELKNVQIKQRSPDMVRAGITRFTQHAQSGLESGTGDKLSLLYRAIPKIKQTFQLGHYMWCQQSFNNLTGSVL